MPQSRRWSLRSTLDLESYKSQCFKHRKVKVWLLVDDNHYSNYELFPALTTNSLSLLYPAAESGAPRVAAQLSLATLLVAVLGISISMV